jgi:integrase/recombinase XerD
VNEFTEADLVAWLNLPGAPATIAQRRKVAMGFFGWADWKGMLKHNPAMGLKRLVPIRSHSVKTHRWLTEAEVRQLLAAHADPDVKTMRTRTILLLGLLCGLRRAEIANLRWGNVDLPGRTMSIVGKGDKPATIGLPPQLIEHCFQWRGIWAQGAGRVPGPDEPVLVAFLTASVGRGAGLPRPGWGLGLHVDSIGRSVSSAGLRAGLGKLEPHDLRRTFAGLLEDRGVRIEDISKALRHSNITTTQRYLEQNPRRAIAVTEGLLLDL